MSNAAVAAEAVERVGGVRASAAWSRCTHFPPTCVRVVEGMECARRVRRPRPSTRRRGRANPLWSIMRSVASLPPVSVPSVRADRSASDSDAYTDEEQQARAERRAATFVRASSVCDRMIGGRRSVRDGRRFERRGAHSTRRARISISRGIAAASRYSHAAARKPGGGGGSSMSSISRPTSPITCTYRLNGRCMKGKSIPGATCSRVSSSWMYGPDPPVLLPEDLVVDPATPRRLEQRVVQEQEEAPAGREHTGDLVDARLDRVDVLDHEAHHHRVESARSDTAGASAIGPGVARAAAALLGDRDLRLASGSTPDHLGAERRLPRRAT